MGSIAYAPGTLVKARGRDWIVLPSPEPEVLRLRPLTGGEGEEIGLFLPVEPESVGTTSFAPPDSRHTGDAAGSLLLFDAARLSLRSGATPFRSLGRLSVTPRPYQFVPLIMALRLDPVRLLIADDVGVGKTVEAAMIARELLDRGLAKRLAVICPAHLCDQWEVELREKFVLDAAVIQPSRIARLERNLPRQDLSIYQYYPHLVVSIDFIKAGRHRDPFLQNAPDLIIVDEAHLAARPRGDFQRIQHQRYAFLHDLAKDPNRHLLLVTATPHSGIEESFRSLLGLLNPRFDVGTQIDRKVLLPHVVQRRRRDLERWLGAETPFPQRDSQEIAYNLSDAYRSLFTQVLSYCRDTVESGKGLKVQQQRVRHWAAIAILRCVLSSPQAAEAVLGERARKKGLEEIFQSVEEVDHGIQPREVAQELEATDPVLGDPQAVQRFLANAAQRFNGRLVPMDKDGVFNLIPGDLQQKLSSLVGDKFPLRVTFDRLKDETALYLGRIHPLIEAYCHEVLGQSFAPEPDELFARSGAIYTDAVRLRTCILLLRCRYLLKEQVEEFAEEIILAGFRRQEGRLVWLEPLEEAARQLLEAAHPLANMPPPERSAQVAGALDMLKEGDWFAPLVAWRVRRLQESHQRLRKLVKAPKLTIQPHTPPDILGCYVLVPGGR